ncbi:unnamed protein product [Phaedon cochleariae]|uniref:Endonuclease-reverse transcriptase n=1 Tax=Phaedon cochleariae TaxID=80249 RepID=A0A9N9SP89_PHACE|nr:unnamed protein product [Phaedon cochleariae]
MSRDSAKPSPVTNEDIFNTLQGIIKQNQDLKDEIHTLKNEIKEELNNLKQKNEELENENKSLKNRLISTEHKLKKYNIVIYGLKEVKEGNEFTQTLSFLQNQVKVNCSEKDIRDAYRIGKQKITGRIRPTLVELSTYKVKKEIFQQVHNLKGLQIFVSNDYTKEELDKRKVLSDNLKLAKAQNLQANIKNNNLLVESQLFTYEDLLNIPISSRNFRKKKFTGKEEDIKPTNQRKNSTRTTSKSGHS